MVSSLVSKDALRPFPWPPLRATAVTVKVALSAMKIRHVRMRHYGEHVSGAIAVQAVQVLLQVCNVHPEHGARVYTQLF